MRWAEHKVTLLSMRESGKSNAEIAEFFDVSVKAVTEAFVRLRARASNQVKDSSDRKGERWSPQENAALIEAGDKNEDFGSIGLRLNRTRWACKVQYNALKRGYGRGAGKIANHVVQRQHATALAKEIRDAPVKHSSITAEFFGDPLPGRSALDRMRAGQCDGVRSVSLAGVVST